MHERDQQEAMQSNQMYGQEEEDEGDNIDQQEQYQQMNFAPNPMGGEPSNGKFKKKCY